MAEDQSIKFSIMSPVYNVEAYIERCIQSVIEQMYANFEFILVDDGSTDNSGRICDQYEKLDSRIKVYHKPNAGILHTRRYAIDRASGDYYLFLDSDDYLKPNALEVIASKIEKYHCDCVSFEYCRVYDGAYLDTETAAFDERYISDKRELYKTVFFDSRFNSMACKAVKADCFDGRDYSAYYGIDLGEDLLQSLEIYENLGTIAIIPDVLYCYRYNPGSITIGVTYEKYKVDYTVRELALESALKYGHFTRQDTEEYCMHWITLLIQQIKQILGFDTTFENKQKLFESIHAQNYYQNFLRLHRPMKNQPLKDRLLLFLFEKRQYGALRMIVAVKTHLRAR